MYESGRVRVSDADREAFVVRLTAATGEGRLTLSEFEERSTRAYAARTWDDLVVVLEDLPQPTYRTSISSAPVYRAPARPAPAYQPPAAVTQNTVALAGMIVGVASLVMSVMLPIGMVLGVGAMVLGALGLRAAGDLPDGAGRGLAWTAIGTGIGGTVLSAASLALFGFAAIGII